MTDGRIETDRETDGQRYEQIETDGHHWHSSTAYSFKLIVKHYNALQAEGKGGC